MSLATYLDLQNSIASWASRSDLATVIPDFIRLAETRINRELIRKGGMEVMTTLTLTGGIEWAALPADFAKANVLYIAGNPIQVLTYKTPARLIEEYPDSTAIGYPASWTVIGNADGKTVQPMRAMFRKVPDGNYTVYMLYQRMVPTLVGNGQAETNWLLTTAPDVYLYASLIETAAYLKKDDDVERFGKGYAQALEDMESADKALRYAGSPTARPLVKMIRGR
jgi:hypothetical protein